MSIQRKKILLAVGGTGGHLFPAQALARDLKMKDPDIELLFAGSGLSKNLYFNRSSFSFKEIQSGTFLTKNLKRNFRGILSLIKGFRQSFKLLREFKPDIVVGFGSYHIFPLLLAAQIKKFPLILFASDSIPGKVIRFFSKKALTSAVQFEEAKKKLKGATTLVHMPFWSKESSDFNLSKNQARKYYNLHPELFTILIFGGSQGAQAINQAVTEISLKKPFQIIHFVGHEKKVDPILDSYQKRGIKACVKPFEDKMHYAWRAADVAVCRAGAATLAEMVFYEIPAILIPYPYAADGHQQMNAKIFEEQVGGAITLLENALSPEKLSMLLQNLELKKMEQNLADFKIKEQKEDLSTLIINYLN